MRLEYRCGGYFGAFGFDQAAPMVTIYEGGYIVALLIQYLFNGMNFTLTCTC